MKRVPITHHFLASLERPNSWKAVRFKRHKSWIDLNWTEYYRRGEAVGLGLAALGIQAGERVAVLSNTRWEWAALDFGILGLGAVTVPIYQSNRAEEIEYVLKDSQARVLVVEDLAQLRKWDAISKKCKTVEAVICLQPLSDPEPGVTEWDEFLDRGQREFADKPEYFAQQIEKTKLSDMATIVYTSGTTGEPKGAVLTHLQIMSEVEDIVRAFPISAQDCTLSFLPYAHVLGRVELWLHTYLGFTLCFAESVDRLKQNLRETRPTVIIGVPRIFEKIFAGIMTETQSNPWRKKIFELIEKRSALTILDFPRQLIAERLLYSKLRAGLGGRLRFTVSGGAPLEPQIAEFFNKAGLLILEGYGLTETTAAIAANTPEAFEFGTVGKPFHDVQIKLDSDGEILVKSDKVMERYYLQEEPTREAFVDGYFRTGDIGEWTERGFLRITDRKKDLIKTAGGKYVAPQKLEGLLKLDPLISNVLIHGDRKKYIVALITLEEAHAKRFAREQGWVFRDYKALTQSLELKERIRKTIASINSKLASYETIKQFAILPNDFTVESGELTPSLKVKRRVADEKYRDVLAELY